MSMPVCNTCQVELVVGENWTEGNVKKHYYICKKCIYMKTKNYSAEHPDHVKTYQAEYYITNKAKANKRAKEWRVTNPGKMREYSLKWHYGMTVEDYESMLKNQDNVCAICHTLPSKKHLVVDHAHDTNIVRGLLCSNCNTGLGLFKDSIDNLSSAIMYLNKVNNNKEN